MLSDGSLVCDCGTQERQGLCCCETMAVIYKYFPDWKGPSQYDISPRWWIYWLKFGHRVGCGEFTSATEELLSCEKAGPSFPHPIPDDLCYQPEIAVVGARERVRNYSIETLNRLVPRPIVHADVHGTHTTEMVDGFTQDSFVAHDPLGCEDGDFHGQNGNDDDVESCANLLFSQSLEVQFAKKAGNARDRLKPYLEELFGCLDCLSDRREMEMESIGKLIGDEVGRLRGILANSTKKRKNQVEDVRTVHAVTETRNDAPKRVKGTRFIPYFNHTQK